MKKRALVIGNSNYQNVGKLKNPTNDSLDIKNSLEKIGFEVTYGEDIALKEFNKKIKSFTDDALGSDILFFYYAGHGLQYNGENYLVPIDADIEDTHEISSESINLGTVESRFAQSNSKANIFILDSCRDNPFEKSIKSYAQSRNISPQIERGLANTTISISESLIAFATSPNEVALDNPTGRNGLFTKSLLKHIMKENLTIQEVLDLTGSDIVEESDNKQRPWIHNSIFKTKAILNFNKDTLVSNVDNKVHLREIDKLKKELNTKEKSDNTLKKLENEIISTLSEMKLTDDIKALERAKERLKALNKDVEMIQIENLNNINSAQENILIYSGVANILNIKKESTFEKTLQNYIKNKIELEKKTIISFNQQFKVRDEFETDIEFQIRKIEFEQKKIKFNNIQSDKINNFLAETSTKEFKENVLNFFLGKQNISMEYNVDTQNFNILVNQIKFNLLIPREIAREFKTQIKFFNIYFNFENGSISEINIEFNNQIFVAKNIISLNENYLRIIFSGLHKEIIERKLKKLLTELNNRFFFSFRLNKEIRKLEKLKKEIERLEQRFMVSVDTDTNLMWEVNKENKKYQWKDIQQHANNLNRKNYAGYNDWRIPTNEEFKTIVNKGNLVTCDRYWSSTSYENNNNYAYYLSFYKGYHDNFATLSKITSCCVKCVRGKERTYWN